MKWVYNRVSSPSSWETKPGGKTTWLWSFEEESQESFTTRSSLSLTLLDLCRTAVSPWYHLAKVTCLWSHVLFMERKPRVTTLSSLFSNESRAQVREKEISWYNNRTREEVISWHGLISRLSSFWFRSLNTFLHWSLRLLLFSLYFTTTDHCIVVQERNASEDREREVCAFQTISIWFTLIHQTGCWSGRTFWHFSWKNEK